jgi:hypothetical protein
MSEVLSVTGSATAAASLRRRLLFARRSFLTFDRLFCIGPLSLLSRFRDWQTPRMPDHAARIVYDLFECLRTGGSVPELGNAELAALDGIRWPQHPRYLGYWRDAAAHSAVGMFVGIDIIRHGGRYYVIECNQGPSIYARRRALYGDSYDPAVAAILSSASSLGFERVVPIALHWSAAYVEEWQRAGRDYAIAVEPTNCPLHHGGGARRIVALPEPLAPGTMYVVHSGLNAPAFTYIDNKWRMFEWMSRAIAEELPAGSRLALPATSEHFFVPSERDPRWPNLVVKLAGSARSRHVLAARVLDEKEGRRTLGVTGANRVPRQFRSGYAKNLLLYGRDHILYQEFIPPELDDEGHALMIRLHLLVSPAATTFLSAHQRVSRRPVPDGAPRGVIREDDAFVFNNADYRLLPANVDLELREVAAQLGDLLRHEIERRFEVEAESLDVT